MGKEPYRELDRRTVLGGIACGSVASIAGCSFFDERDDADVSEVGDEEARALAEQYAPTLYFDQHEKWYPTDPRPYESEQDGETVVDGFDALEGYVQEGGEEPSESRVFFHAVKYDDSPLAVVQFWFYSVFDQFSTNFHWHDWELLQVFVDTETDEPQLYVASAHSRSAPNNEYLDPENRPRVLVELGSHSSGLSVNDVEDQFQRLPIDDGIADITNSVVENIGSVLSIPLAYGLPRDEGLALPFAVPELDGAPIYEHDRLPSVTASDLIPEELTIGSFDALRSPPTDLPQRTTGYQFEHENRDDSADVAYDLVPTEELEHITEFTGPQLSFEFEIPDYIENIIASHITTTGVPWKDSRYTNPATDISEADHRQALADRYSVIGEPSEVSQVIAEVSNLASTDDAPESEGLESVSSPLELFALFQSEPKAVPTFNGIAVLQNVPEGEHTLTINGAGVTPHSEQVTVADEDETTLAGVDGEIPVVAREKATKLEVDPSEADSELNRLAVEDDFAGRLYDAPLSGPDAVYIHQGGAFTTEVRDTDDEIGAFRVNPDTEAQIRIDEPRTGKSSLAAYLADIAEEMRSQISASVEEQDDDDDDDDDQNGVGNSGNSVQGLLQALDAVVESAQRAAEDARANNLNSADQRLETVADRLERVGTRLVEARGSLPEGLGNAAEKRLEQSRRRADQAKNSNKP